MPRSAAVPAPTVPPPRTWSPKRAHCLNDRAPFHFPSILLDLAVFAIVRASEYSICVFHAALTISVPLTRPPYRREGTLDGAEAVALEEKATQAASDDAGAVNSA